MVEKIGYKCDRAENYELGSEKPFTFNISKTIKGTRLEENFLFTKRDNLLNALFKECENDPNITVALGKKAESFNEENNSVTVTFSDGTSETADVAICADGIHSVGKHHIEGENFAKPEHRLGYRILEVKSSQNMDFFLIPFKVDCVYFTR